MKQKMRMIKSKRRCTASYTPEEAENAHDKVKKALYCKLHSGGYAYDVQRGVLSPESFFHHERKTNVLPPRTRVALAMLSRDNFEYLQASILTFRSRKPLQLPSGAS